MAKGLRVCSTPPPTSVCRVRGQKGKSPGPGLRRLGEVGAAQAGTVRGADGAHTGPAFPAQLAQQGAPSSHCQAVHPWDAISPGLSNWHCVGRWALGERPSCVPLWLLPAAL